jgi:hypothetical protein
LNQLLMHLRLLDNDLIAGEGQMKWQNVMF